METKVERKDHLDVIERAGVGSQPQMWDAIHQNFKAGLGETLEEMVLSDELCLSMTLDQVIRQLKGDTNGQ